MSKSTQPFGMNQPKASTLGHITPSQVVGRSLPATGSHVKKGFTKTSANVKSNATQRRPKNSSF